MTWLDKKLAWVLRPLIVVGVVSLFLVAFYESWAALRHAATEAQIAHPQQWPWSVDGFILVMALIIADAMRTRATGWWSRGGGGVWWARVGILAATGLSTSIQAIYAPGDFPSGGWYLHAWNAPAVLVSFELLMWLVYGHDPKATPAQPAAHPEPAERRDPIPDPGAAAASGPTGDPAGISLLLTGHQVGPGRAVAPHPGGQRPAGTRAERQRVAGSVPEAATRPEPPTPGGERPPLGIGDKATRKAMYERLRHDYRRGGLSAAEAAAKRGVSLADTEALWVQYEGLYGRQNGDHRPEPERVG